MKSAKEFWDKAAPRYAKRRIRHEEIYHKKLAITQEYLRPDGAVLEFGCGTGSTAIVHAPHVGHVLATDISAEMLAIAASKARDAGIDNIDFQQGTLDGLELERESFDAVLGLNILHLLEDVEATMSRVHALLKQGGVFVSSTALIADIAFYWRWLIPVLQRLGFAPYVKCLDKQALVSLLTSAGFSIEYEWQPTKASLFLIARKRAEPACCQGGERR
ncbi:class I SAM-dependent methyltransferase [Billgrantia azerbaijanica]|nr:class I SAM-dependent methyltransferase [Halomonas azerbaijanica]